MHETFMQMAIEQAQLAYAKNEVPIGAVIVKNNQVIAVGHNQPITDTDPTAHAEIIALRRAAQLLENYRLNDCDVYVTLEPCPMCLGAMLYARIRHLYFAAFDKKLGAVQSVFQLLDAPQINHRINYQAGILAASAKKLLKDFFKERR